MSQNRKTIPVILFFVTVVAAAVTLLVWGVFFGSQDDDPSVSKRLLPTEAAMRLTSDEFFAVKSGLDNIEDHWDERYLIMLIETLPYLHTNTLPQVHALLMKKTSQQFGVLDPRWFSIVWQKPYNVFDDYAGFKKRLYSEKRDPRFAEYFDVNYKTKIRLDEILNGGVVRDGIPPLNNPVTLAASDAEYMDDTNEVFGVVVNGKARAYPRRILAWHEMVKDQLGGKSINGVYCTLCGSMIVYETELNGQHYELGTSGFLYRSNKLMYDYETKSLWSTIAGEPVVGPLVDKGIKLKQHYVVTTNWGKWKELHPNTTVLSLKTGHKRDYREGAAYRDYFATDDLMFEVPVKNNVLPNKEPVLALRYGRDPENRLAITIRHLKKNRVFAGELAGIRFVVLTDSTGAARVYERGDVAFKSWNEADSVTDQQGAMWTVSEQDLVSTDGKKLDRLPAHNAFWFGWYAAFPDTKLID